MDERLIRLRDEIMLRHGLVDTDGKQIAQLARRQVANAIAAGESLREAKAVLPHGKWMPWVHRELRGVGHRTATRYMLLAEHRAQIGHVSNLAEAYDLIKRLRLDEKRKALYDAPPPIPWGSYKAIVADPPWPLEGGRLPYNVMDLDAIRALPVIERAAEDSVLFLWTVDRFLPDAFTVIEAWGFEWWGRTIVWVKNIPAPHPLLPGRHELCLVATRGQPTILPGASTVINAPRRAHSQKPDQLFDLVETMIPAAPHQRIELFARDHRPGWTVWGDQVVAA